MKKYIFNDSDVCVNPDIFGYIEKDMLNKIEVAQYRDRWTFGILYSQDHNGCGGFAPSKWSAQYDSKRDAVIAGITWMRDYIRRSIERGETYSIDTVDGHISKPETFKRMQACIDRAVKEINKVKQLTLFSN